MISSKYYFSNLLNWKFKKQLTVLLSSTEAEYMKLTQPAKGRLYNLSQELGQTDMRNIMTYTDNLSALKLTKNSSFYNRSKHINIMTFEKL